MKKLFNLTQNQNFISLFYLMLSMLLSAATVGINVVTFPSILIENGVRESLIGFVATFDMICGIISALFIARLTAKLGATFSTIIIAVIQAITVSTIFFYQNYFLWLILSGIGACCWFAMFIIKQAWVNNIISDKNRSLVLAFGTTIFCLGFILGSLIVKHFGALNYHSFLTSSFLILFSGLILLIAKNTEPKNIDSDHIGFIRFFKKVPNESTARFFLDFQSGIIICLGIIFGKKIGLSSENSGLLLAAFTLSGIFDLYAGFLVRKFDRKKLIVYGFIFCFLSMLPAIFFHHNYLVLLASFFFIGVAFALIIVATLTNINESFVKTELVAANATYQAIGTLGSMFGCLIGGILIDFFGFYGFFIGIFSAIILYLSYYIILNKRS